LVFIEYDFVADALYVWVRNSEIVNSIEISENVSLDLNDKKEIIGIKSNKFSRSKIDLNNIVSRSIKTVM